MNGDLKNESAPARLEFRAITGYNDGPWYDGNKDTKDVSEVWADLYGSCAWRGLRTVKNHDEFWQLRLQNKSRTLQ